MEQELRRALARLLEAHVDLTCAKLLCGKVESRSLFHSQQCVESFSIFHPSPSNRKQPNSVSW